MDLKQFGLQLAELRKASGLTQEALGELIGYEAPIVSNWERAYEHQGRVWRPNRQAVIDLVTVFSERLSPAKVRSWALMAEHDLSQSELQKIFPDHFALFPKQNPPLPTFFVERVSVQQTLIQTLSKHKAAALVGPGGTGKSVLSSWAAQALVEQFPDGIFWIRCQTENAIFEAQGQIAASLKVHLTARSLAGRASELRTLLYDSQCLIILDDIEASPDLVFLRVVNEQSCLMVTSRDSKVANLLNIPRLQIGGLSREESLALLAHWVEAEAADELVTRLGGLPLALNLSGAQLRAGHFTVAELTTYFQQARIDLGAIDMDDPQTRTESLNQCFAVSYDHLSEENRRYFAQLGCFAASFEKQAAATVWNVYIDEAQTILRRLVRFSLLERNNMRYFLHPLLRDYARMQLHKQPKIELVTCHRHATWYIRRNLFHPRLWDDETTPAPSLTDSWPEITAGVRRAVTVEPKLAAVALWLAYGDRPALAAQITGLESAVEHCLSITDDNTERAVWLEQLANLVMWREQPDLVQAAQLLNEAGDTLKMDQDWLAAATMFLRQAGVHLLQEQPGVAVCTLRHAMELVRQSYPVPAEMLDDLRWIFYWFDVLFSRVVLWPDYPQEIVNRITQLAERDKSLCVSRL